MHLRPHVLLSPSSSAVLFLCLSVAAAGAQDGDHSEARSWLVGSLLVQALPRVHRLPAVLHPQDEGQARVEEAEDRSSLSGALQEAQQRHGEQDHAAAEKNRRAGEFPFFPPFLFLYLCALIHFCYDLPVFLSVSRLQNKDNRSVNERLVSLENSYTAESERMRGELSRLRGVEEEAKNKTNQVSSLLEELERLRKELITTQQEKKTIEDWAQTYRDEMEKVRQKSRSIFVLL